MSFAARKQTAIADEDLQFPQPCARDHCLAGIFKKSKNKTQTSHQCLSFQVEAPSRLELESEAFAELCLTTWPWRRFGAVDEIRTRDIHLGKVALYH